MKRFLTLAVLPTLAAGPVSAETRMTMGDGLIDGERIAPYSLSWQQCARQDGEWRNIGAVTEELAVIGSVIRHRQVGHQPGAVRVQNDTYFERSTFAPLRIETAVSRDGGRLKYSVRRLTKSGYTGEEISADEHRTLAGVINSTMLHGSAMGLPLATMAYQKDPVTFLASMVAFDGTYEVSARWVGTQPMLINGNEIDTWMIDVEWLHLESGDVYAAGPDGSGGRYWVIPDPPAGVPYVPRYQTDSFAVEFTADVCPTSE